MKKLTSLILAFCLGIILQAQTEVNWLVKMDEAKTLATDQERPILISFSGSDWCGNCMRLGKELFETEDFLEYANENLVLLNLDFPAKKANKLSEELSVQNDKFAEIYNKQGVFPLTIVVNAEGELMGKVKYPSSSVQGYLDSINDIIH